MPIRPDQKLFIALIGFGVAVLFAKLPFWIFNDEVLHNTGTFLASGKTILLGMVGGYLGVELAKWRLGITIKTGDWFAVPVAAGMAVGRLGCLASGCCYGAATDLPWGMIFSAAGPIARHPVQIYESIFHAEAAGVLYWLLARGRFRNQLIKLYLIAYFVFRFLTEFIRPEIQWWGGLTAYQWAITILIPLFALLWWRDAGAVARMPSYEPDTTSDGS